MFHLQDRLKCDDIDRLSDETAACGRELWSLQVPKEVRTLQVGPWPKIRNTTEH